MGNLRKALGYGGGGGYAEFEGESSGMVLSGGEGVGGLYGDFSYGNGGGNGGENDARPEQPQREHMCWTSSGDYSSPSPAGVTIHGRGCSTCIRGQRCSFRLSVRAPARWAEGVLHAGKRGWWKRDVTVTMRGPAMGAGNVRCLDPPRCREMRVTYRLWDGGEYLATMHIGCANLRFSPLYYLHLNKTAQHDLVSWPLTGRWRMRKGLYRWEPFFCADKELPASSWIAALEQRGIREISIVGDSHQRYFTAHLYYLLMRRADLGVKKWRDNLFYSAKDGEGRELKINFYWIDGIYRNGEFGCSHRGATTNRTTQFPNISSTADVTLFEGGYWGASFCQEPLKALRVYLREFVRWGISAVAPGKGRVVFRTIPSFAVRREKGGAGEGRRGDRVEGGGEGMAWKDLDESLQRLPGEEVEGGSHVGPIPDDHHYSNVVATDDGDVVVGEVGEAHVRAFIHYLLYTLPPPAK
ncbi:unnamed protein product [Closterium sp. Naga37s-1]|nr:unnamed protein product [Closterium sp. Naga37s-1]